MKKQERHHLKQNEFVTGVASVVGAYQENKDKAAKASPTTYITRGMPPFLIMHGDHDLEVPIRQSEIFAEALNKVGADVTFIPIKGAGHGIGGPQAIEPVSSFLKRMTGN